MDLGEKALRKLIDARNESDTGFRTRLLDECWAEEGCLQDGANRRVEGRQALSDVIAAQLRDPYHWVELKGRVDRTPDELRARWRVRNSSGSREQDVTVVPAPAGKIRSVVATDREVQPNFAKRLSSMAADNPVAALGVATAALYVVLRIPLGLFYNDLGVTPEEAGYTTEHLLRQSIIMLLALVLAGALATPVFTFLIAPTMRLAAVRGRLSEVGQPHESRIVFLIAMAPIVVSTLVFMAWVFLSSSYLFGSPWIGGLIPLASIFGAYVVGPWLAFKHPAARRVRPAVEDRERRSSGPTTPGETLVGGVVGGAIGLLLFTLPLVALTEADAIREGESSGGRLLPWRAIPAKLRFAEGAPRAGLSNDCEHLRFLGESDRRVILFDTKLDKAFRIPGDQVAVSLQREC